MSLTIASYHGPYGYGATIRATEYGRYELFIHANGKTVFKGNYSSRSGARTAMNRFSDIWTLEK